VFRVRVIKYIGWTFAWLAAFVWATWATGALYFDFPATVGLAAILFVRLPQAIHQAAAHFA
jgi:hypothetical protein